MKKQAPSGIAGPVIEVTLVSALLAIVYCKVLGIKCENFIENNKI